MHRMGSKQAEIVAASSSHGKNKIGSEASRLSSELKDTLDGNAEAGSPGWQSMGPWKFESVGGFLIPAEDVSNITVQRQEQLLIRDLIYALSGVPSTYIRLERTQPANDGLCDDQIDKVRFKIDERFSGVFRTLANELLPLIGHYISVQSFVEESTISTDCSRTLGIAARKCMQPYFELQAEFETQLHERKLGLQQLVHQLRPWLPTMECLASLISRVRTSKLNTAQLLSLVNEYQEHFKCERLSPLITEVSYHYMKMVQLWTQKGALLDVRREFFVEDTTRNAMLGSSLLAPKIYCYEYWLKRYRMHVERIPSFLEPHIEHIFLAGKYLNILRHCKLHMQLMQAPLSYVIGDQTHVQLIRSSYELAAGTLLQVLVQEGHLLEHLESLQAYFLLQDSVAIGSLLDAHSEGLLSSKDLLEPKELVKDMLNIFQQSNDPNTKHLSCQLMDCNGVTDLIRHLKRQRPDDDEAEADERTDEADDTMKNTDEAEDGNNDVRVTTTRWRKQPSESGEELREELAIYGYEAFSLWYKPEWPASLFLHDESLEDLRLLHRVLFFIRFVLRQMHVTKQNMPNTDALYDGMMQCMEQLEQYMLQDILRPRWDSMMANAKKAKLVDELIDEFDGTLHLCLLHCFTSEPVTFVRSIYTLGQLCLNYHSFVHRKASGDGLYVDSDWFEYDQGFNSLVDGIVNLLTELARPNSVSGNEERSAYQRLLHRLEDLVSHERSSN